jgi:hypothetical protein
VPILWLGVLLCKTPHRPTDGIGNSGVLPPKAVRCICSLKNTFFSEGFTPPYGGTKQVLLAPLTFWKKKKKRKKREKGLTKSSRIVILVLYRFQRGKGLARNGVCLFGCAVRTGQG